MIWLLLMGSLPLDSVGDPLPRYLVEARVFQALRTLEPVLGECATEEDATIPAELDFHGNGSVEVVELKSASAGVTECLKKAFESFSAPTHDDLVQKVWTTVYIRDGALFLSPDVSLHQRELSPLLLFVTDEARESVKSAIIGAEPMEQ